MLENPIIASIQKLRNNHYLLIIKPESQTKLAMLILHSKKKGINLNMTFYESNQWLYFEDYDSIQKFLALMERKNFIKNDIVQSALKDIESVSADADIIASAQARYSLEHRSNEKIPLIRLIKLKEWGDKFVSAKHGKRLLFEVSDIFCALYPMNKRKNLGDDNFESIEVEGKLLIPELVNVIGPAYKKFHDFFIVVSRLRSWRGGVESLVKEPEHLCEQWPLLLGSEHSLNEIKDWLSDMIATGVNPVSHQPLLNSEITVLERINIRLAKALEELNQIPNIDAPHIGMAHKELSVASNSIKVAQKNISQRPLPIQASTTSFFASPPQSLTKSIINSSGNKAMETAIHTSTASLPIFLHVSRLNPPSNGNKTPPKSKSQNELRADKFIELSLIPQDLRGKFKVETTLNIIGQTTLDIDKSVPFSQVEKIALSLKDKNLPCKADEGLTFNSICIELLAKSLDEWLKNYGSSSVEKHHELSTRTVDTKVNPDLPSTSGSTGFAISIDTLETTIIEKLPNIRISAEQPKIDSKDKGKEKLVGDIDEEASTSVQPDLEAVEIQSFYNQLLIEKQQSTNKDDLVDEEEFFAYMDPEEELLPEPSEDDTRENSPYGIFFK